MARTPQPLVADCVAPLGHHLRQTAPAARMGGQGPGLPPRVLGVLVAEAHLPISAGEEAGVGQRAPVDIPAQVCQAVLPAVRGRFTGHDPPCGPDHLRKAQVGPFLTHQIEPQPAQARREGMDGHQGGWAGGPPLGPVGGDPTGWHQTGHMWRLAEGPGPGVEAAAHADEPPDIMGVGGERDERWGRGAEHNVVQVWLVAADQLPPCLGPGADDRTGGDGQEVRPPLCQPPRGVMRVALGATAGAAGVVDVRCLTTMIAWPQLPAQRRGPALEHILQRPAMAGPQVLSKALQVVAPRARQDRRHLWHAQAPTC